MEENCQIFRRNDTQIAYHYSVIAGKQFPSEYRDSTPAPIQNTFDANLEESRSTLIANPNGVFDNSDNSDVDDLFPPDDLDPSFHSDWDS